MKTNKPCCPGFLLNNTQLVAVSRKSSQSVPPYAPCPFLTPAHNAPATLASLGCWSTLALCPHLGPAGPETQVATSAQEPSLTTASAAPLPQRRPFVNPTLILSVALTTA